MAKLGYISKTTMQSFITWFLRLSMMLYFQAVTCLKLEANQVVLKDYNMSLVCSVSTKINATISIGNPSGNIVTCNPTGIIAARCSLPNYVIDETAQTVTLTRLAALNDDGNWTCEYASKPIQTTTINIIVETLVPINGGPLYINTTAVAGETLTSATNDVFSAIYGCFSSAVKFKWKLAADSWQIVPQASTVYTCATPGTSAYVSTQTASEIWSHFPSGSKQTPSVTVLTMDSYELSVSTFSVYFSKGYTTTPATLPTTNSTEKPQETCFWKAVEFSKDRCYAYYALAVVSLFFIIIVIIKICCVCLKRNQRKQNKNEDQQQQFTHIEKNINHGLQDVSGGQDLAKKTVSKDNETQNTVDSYKNCHGIEHKRTGYTANAITARNTEKSFTNIQDDSRENLNQFDLKQITVDYEENWNRSENL